MTSVKRPKSAKAGLKAAATRQRLLEVSVKAFEDEGFEAATLRGIAKSAKMSLGAFYYHFGSKEDIVMELYKDSLRTFQKEVDSEDWASKNFSQALARTLELRIDSMKARQPIFRQLLKHAMDPESQISPFSEASLEIRQSSILIFEKMITAVELKVPSSLKADFPRLLWLLMMGIILFWIHDQSPAHKRTYKLIQMASKNTDLLLKALNLPFVGAHILPMKELITFFSLSDSSEKLNKKT
jgi:AcrR family transcriptional regulator